MENAILSKEKLTTFVDAGSTSLGNYSFVSQELNEKRGTSLSSPKLKSAKIKFAQAESGESKDSEMGVQFRLNQTGNIFYSTTSPELQGETKRLFDSVTVLFAAMTKALSEKGKDLFDYAAWSALISKTGYFVEVQKFENILTIENNSLTIDTQIVQQLLPGLTSGSSMKIAQSVLSALNGAYKSEKTTESTKLGHLLFICEELFGAPSVTVRLFFASKSSHSKITSSPCHQTSSVTFDQLQEANTFLFVSPDTIAEFADLFGETPQAYKDLVAKLSGYLS